MTARSRLHEHRALSPLRRLGERALDRLFQRAKRLPLLRDRIAAEYAKLLGDIRRAAKPYAESEPRVTVLPERGRDHGELLADMQRLATRERERWHDGFVSGAVYHGDDEHVAFLSQVYASFSQTNPLHADVWPSVVKYEAEIVAMTAALLGAAHVEDAGRFPGPAVGVVSSGGTESIMLAMKTYRDWARVERGITSPQVVAPSSAHVAFDKAAQAFGLELVRVPVGEDFRADVPAMRRAVTRNTICIVGSAPGFPHGVIDPIEALSELARARGIGFHTDACLGGFVLPFARELGWQVPRFDFALPGVTSISADTHKYGYAAKGTSVVLYRSAALRRYQYFTATEWPGGMYLSPTFAGSRPGALSAACWAAMIATGKQGYLDATQRILQTARSLRAGISAIDGLRVLGEPLFVIAFASDAFDIYRVLDAMTRRHWNLNGLHKPAAVHLCVTLRHTQPGVAERFLADLRASVDEVRSQPAGKGGLAPIYGLAGTIPVRSAVGDLMRAYLDVLYEA
ncbi:MAG: aminotransferase class V-fold PLP-dependent enzyme [Nannocystaceae bacterium]|nr:aminotransferase class V-fold PLP-dependent enzyme [Nannocystaceae bacterium]